MTVCHHLLPVRDFLLMMFYVVMNSINPLPITTGLRWQCFTLQQSAHIFSNNSPGYYVNNQMMKRKEQPGTAISVSGQVTSLP
ncbi:hypothetical protein Xmir_03398 [Xenorhabdus miraniensis]|uniref:Uncharacterized protein n=1 Tax=Xenorhabdus miraniensis TaxID=351674 RepID=A0A2D0JMG1_9GAMM|nr:hypothetical protein Xmir_04086 [Xenorhabdus miraniensis]PHM47342.1 hypothetical protein Xmir_03398 [Xenorhabdus miraniensis]